MPAGAVTWIAIENGRLAAVVVPKISPLSFRICQLPRYSPGSAGALKFMTRSMLSPGATSLGSGMRFRPPNKSPLTKTRRYVVFHVQVPAFFKRQTFVKEEPGANTELFGTFKLSTNSMRSQPRFGVGVGDLNAAVGVRVWFGVLVGVREGVHVAEGEIVAVREAVA